VILWGEHFCTRSGRDLIHMGTSLVRLALGYQGATNRVISSWRSSRFLEVPMGSSDSRCGRGSRVCPARRVPHCAARIGHTAGSAQTATMTHGTTAHRYSVRDAAGNTLWGRRLARWAAIAASETRNNSATMLAQTSSAINRMLLRAKGFAPAQLRRERPVCLQFFSAICTPSADKLNFRPTSVATSLMITPCSFLRYSAVPPPATVKPAPAAT